MRRLFPNINKVPQTVTQTKKIEIKDRYVITLTGDSEHAIDSASKEIEQIAKEKNATVCTITNLNGLVEGMKSCKCGVIINKCYGMNGNELTHLARFIRNPVWHPWMLYIGANAETRHDGVDKLNELGVNQIYPLKATMDIKRSEMEHYLN